MEFHEIAKRFEMSESGTDSFKRFYKDTFLLMKSDPGNSAVYFVVAIAARLYVHRYEDLAVDLATADYAKNKIVEFNNKIIQSLSLGAQERLIAIGEIAYDYEWNVESF